MSSSGAAVAHLGTPNTFTGLVTFNGGVVANNAGAVDSIVTQGIAKSTVSVAAAHPVAATDEIILADATAGAFAVTLPTAVGAQGRIITVKKTDATANAVTVASAGGTIDGAVSIAMATAQESLTVVSDNANWKVIYQVATIIL